MLALVLTSLLVTSRLEEPFADLDYKAALAQAQSKKKLLLVDFTASWCGPCRQMEKVTWADAGVRSWLADNTIAIQVDVDDEPDLAREFQIDSIPAVIALRDGKEVDRSVGYRDPAAFLDWSKGVSAGKSSKDDLRERAQALKDSPDVEARLDLARDLMRAGQYDEALTHFSWLWTATRSVPEMRGVRLTFMLNDMAKLAGKHAPAKQAFLELLVGLQARVDQAELPTSDDWMEWTALCEKLGQRPRILAWYEKRRDADGRLFTGKQDEPVPEMIISSIFDELMESERAPDAVRLYENPRARADGLVKRYQEQPSADPGLDPKAEKELALVQRKTLVKNLSRLYGALLAAERREEASDVAHKLLAVLDTPESRLSLVRAGLDQSKGPNEDFARWLDEAEAGGANARTLRRRLPRPPANSGAAEKGDAGGG